MKLADEGLEFTYRGFPCLASNHKPKDGSEERGGEQEASTGYLCAWNRKYLGRTGDDPDTAGGDYVANVLRFLYSQDEKTASIGYVMSGGAGGDAFQQAFGDMRRELAEGLRGEQSGERENILCSGPMVLSGRGCCIKCRLSSHFWPARLFESQCGPRGGIMDGKRSFDMPQRILPDASHLTTFNGAPIANWSSKYKGYFQSQNSHSVERSFMAKLTSR